MISANNEIDPRLVSSASVIDSAIKEKILKQIKREGQSLIFKKTSKEL